MIPAQQKTYQQEKNNSVSSTHSAASGKLDTLIVFGEGPVKPVFIPQELTPDLVEKWQHYKDNPTSREPNFTVLEEKHYISKILEIDTSISMSDEEKDRERTYLRRQWQWTGHFALKRWGRQNALAAGMALYTGLTEKIILSGGKTHPWWTKKHFPQEFLNRFPSEAELMRDIIKRNFEKLYFEKYQVPIEKVILIEDASTNTLENFAYSINKYPELLSKDSRVGLLSASHHIKRITMLAELFSMPIREAFSSHELLKRAREDTSSNASKLADKLIDMDCVCEQDVLKDAEQRWIRGLQDPEYITYWVGYVAEVKYPQVLEEVIRKISDPSWLKAVQDTLKFVGINIQDFVGVDLAYLSKNEPEKYMGLVKNLRKCKTPEYRKTPPPLK